MSVKKLNVSILERLYNQLTTDDQDKFDKLCQPVVYKIGIKGYHVPFSAAFDKPDRVYFIKLRPPTTDEDAMIAFSKTEFFRKILYSYDLEQLITMQNGYMCCICKVELAPCEHQKNGVLLKENLTDEELLIILKAKITDKKIIIEKVEFL